jgi:hypothetical protein
MSKKGHFDMNAFQNQVIQEFDFLKTTNNFDSQYFENPFLKYETGTGKQSYFRKFIWTSFFKIIGCLEKKALQVYSENSNITEYERKSKDILLHPGLKRILCAKLREKISPSLLEQEKELTVIKIVTLSLVDENSFQDLSVELDAKLFAYIVHGILEKGVENYCSHLLA